LDKKPVIAPITHATLENDIKHFTERHSAIKDKQNTSMMFGYGERYEPTNWPIDETINLICRNTPNSRRNTKFQVPGPKYYHQDKPHPKNTVMLSKVKNTLEGTKILLVF
jgi:hypothetical protein